MIQVETPLFGRLEIREEETIHFPGGLPGFEEARQFVIIRPDEDIPFSYMQCVDMPELSFIVTNPFLFCREYEFELPEAVQQELGITDEKELIVWSIVTIKDRLRDATMNLLAPVIVNTKTRIGKQVVLHDTPYTTKHRLIDEAVPE